MANRGRQLSVLREAALAREMHEAGVLGIKHLYMGQSERLSHTREPFNGDFDRFLHSLVSEDAIQGRLLAVILARPRRLYVGSSRYVPPPPGQVPLRVLHTSRTITRHARDVSGYVLA